MDIKILNRALILSIITISYNIIEGVVSVFYGLQDDTLALFGFGIDSFVEVISGIGIFHMVMRMKKMNITERDEFEKSALKITGFSFYLLTVGLVIGSVINIIEGIKPETTVVGIIVSTISLITMYFLMNAKLKVGKELKSDAIIADANCTKTCFYLSLLLLISSSVYEFTDLLYVDIIGSLGIAYFAFTEGKEAFQKIRTGNLACSCNSHCSSGEISG